MMTIMKAMLDVEAEYHVHVHTSNLAWCAVCHFHDLLNNVKLIYVA